MKSLKETGIRRFIMIRLKVNTKSNSFILLQWKLGSSTDVHLFLHDE